MTLSTVVAGTQRFAVHIPGAHLSQELFVARISSYLNSHWMRQFVFRHDSIRLYEAVTHGNNWGTDH